MRLFHAFDTVLFEKVQARSLSLFVTHGQLTTLSMLNSCTLCCTVGEQTPFLFDLAVVIFKFSNTYDESL